MATVAALAHHVWTGMVRIGRQKTLGSVTETAIRGGSDMILILAPGSGAVMAALAGTGNTAMVESAIRIQFEESRGVVAIITFGTGFNVERRLADCQDPVMALATGTEDFKVIYVRDLVKTQW